MKRLTIEIRKRNIIYTIISKPSYCKTRDFMVQLRSKTTMDLANVIILIGRSTMQYQLHDFKHQLKNPIISHMNREIIQLSSP